MKRLKFEFILINSMHVIRVCLVLCFVYFIIICFIRLSDWAFEFKTFVLTSTQKKKVIFLFFFFHSPFCSDFLLNSLRFDDGISAGSGNKIEILNIWKFKWNRVFCFSRQIWWINNGKRYKRLFMAIP